MSERTLRIGTRASALALWQANWVKDRLEERYPDLSVTLTKIQTQGDKILDVPLAMVGGKGLFVKEIQEAMLRGEIDIAVHSMKDVPTFFPEGHRSALYHRAGRSARYHRSWRRLQQLQRNPPEWPGRHLLATTQGAIAEAPPRSADDRYPWQCPDPDRQAQGRQSRCCRAGGSRDAPPRFFRPDRRVS